MTSDSELLRRYADHGDEAAFAEVVRRQVDLVYSAALRMTGGDAPLSQDAAQNVFTLLAQRARPLSEHPSIVGWLYTTTRMSVRNLTRGERRRILREQEAYAMQNTATSPEFNWESLRPVLDEAVCQLNAGDREAVLLRFFQSKSHREVGAALGVQEDAARKRVDRALEKLRTHFARRGVTVTVALLATAITANSVQAAPATLAATLTGGALTSAASVGTMGIFLKTLYMTTQTKMILMAAVFIAAAAVPLFLQQQELAQLREQLTAFQRDGRRSARNQNRSAVLTGAASHSLTLAEIQAKIKSLSAGGRNWDKQWQAFVDSLDPADLSRVIACLEQQLPNLDHRASFLMPLLALWAKSDPQAALAYLDKYPAGALRDLEVEAALKGWTDVDPAAAAKWWQELPAGSTRTASTITIVNALSEKDPQAAFELVMHLTPQLQASLMQDVFLAWAKSDPAAAVAQASQMKVGQLRYLAFRDLAMGWAEIDPQAALTWADSLPSGVDKAIAVSMSVQFLAGNKPEQATDYVLHMPPGQERDQSIRGLASTLAENSPAKAWELAQQLPDGRDKQNAQTQIATTWAESDPQGALEFAQSLSPTTAQSLLGKIADGWARNDPKAAIAQAGNLPEGASRNTYLSGLFEGLLADSPNDAANLVANLPADKQAAAVDRVTFRLSDLDPPAAVAWAATQPGGLPSDKATQAIVNQWAMYDPAAASQWINTLPAGSVRDNAIQSYVGRLTTSYPSYAAPWAQSIGDENTRNAAIEKVARSWLMEDPPKAAAWLAGTSLPDDRKQKLLNPGK